MFSFFASVSVVPHQLSFSVALATWFQLTTACVLHFLFTMMHNGIWQCHLYIFCNNHVILGVIIYNKYIYCKCYQIKMFTFYNRCI